jgi:hypothetical protein
VTFQHRFDCIFIQEYLIKCSTFLIFYRWSHSLSFSHFTLPLSSWSCIRFSIRSNQKLSNWYFIEYDQWLVDLESRKYFPVDNHWTELPL